MALSLPPFGLWPLAFGRRGAVQLGPERPVSRRRALCGLLAGVGQLAIGLAWADKFTLLGYLALVVVQSAMFAVACALAPGGRARVPALAALLTLAEWARDSLALRRRAAGGDRPRPGRRPAGRDRPRRRHRCCWSGSPTSPASPSETSPSACSAVGDAARHRHGHGLLGGCLGLVVVIALALFGALAPDGGPSLCGACGSPSYKEAASGASPTSRSRPPPSTPPR